MAPDWANPCVKKWFIFREANFSSARLGYKLYVVDAANHGHPSEFPCVACPGHMV
jgi:hypothetical protein